MFISNTPSTPGTDDARLSAVQRIVTVVVAAVFTLGCQTKSVTAPTPNPAPAANPSVNNSSVTVTVQVLTRGAEQPIAGAAVWENGLKVGETDGTGVSRIVGPSGADYHIAVTATGYVGFGASGTVTSDERWQFYLEAQQHQ